MVINHGNGLNRSPHPNPPLQGEGMLIYLITKPQPIAPGSMPPAKRVHPCTLSPARGGSTKHLLLTGSATSNPPLCRTKLSGTILDDRTGRPQGEHHGWCESRDQGVVIKITAKPDCRQKCARLSYFTASPLCLKA